MWKKVYGHFSDLPLIIPESLPKEIIKLYNGVPLNYALHELNTTNPLNRYLTIFRLKELAELKLGDTVQRYKSRFKNDNTAATIRDLLWNLEVNRHHI